MNATKLYLIQYRRQVERIRQIENRIAQLTAAIESSPVNDGMPRGTNISRKVEALAVRLAEEKTKAEAAAVDAWAVRLDIERVIDAVQDPALARLLYDRYITGRDWSDIAQALAYDESYTRGRLHLKALDAAGAIIGTDRDGKDATQCNINL